MKTVVLILLVFGAISISHRNLQAQSGNEWSVARQSDMEIKVPSWCSITQGGAPINEGLIVDLDYISACANTKGFFVCALCSSSRDPHPEDSDALYQRALERFLGKRDKCMLPDIDTFVLDTSAIHVTDYKALGQAVSETTATSVRSGQKFKIFYLVAVHRLGPFRRVYSLYVGCPEDEISDYKRSMSYILDSFTAR